MKIIYPTQCQVDELHLKFLDSPEISQFYSTGRCIGKFEVNETDWSSITLLIEDTAILKVDIDRSADIEFTIALYSLDTLATALLLRRLKSLIRMYKPKAINSECHESNIKSINLNRKVFGKEYGIKKAGAWNMAKGEYEDLFLFRKVYY